MRSDDTAPGLTNSERSGALKVITWRLMPLFCLMYLIAYIDRQNVSYAKLEMADALGMSEAVYGLGASLFFIGYFLFEAPANLVLARVGARVWFTRIMATWGVITVLLGFTNSPLMFYVLRFLLGVAEAGFFPGVLYVLTLWYPQSHRGRMVGAFMVASAFANAVGALLGGLLLDMDGLMGLQGWQWVFVATGLPAVLLAPYVLWKLPNGPDKAPWLTDVQKASVAEDLAGENADPTHAGADSWRAMLDRRVLMLATMYVGFPLAAYGLSYWLPTVVKGFGATNAQNGAINVIPWLMVALALWLLPRWSARMRQTQKVQSWFIAGPAFVGATALVLSVLVPGNAAKFALLCVAAPAIFCAQPMFWSLPPTFLRGAGAAAGIAAINSIGNLGGFVAQTAVPAIKEASGSDLTPMLFLAACLTVAGLSIFLVLPRLKPGPVA